MQIQLHQPPTNVKQLRDHDHGDAFHKTFQMNSPSVKVVFFSKIIFKKIWIQLDPPEPFVQSTDLKKYAFYGRPIRLQICQN